MTARIVLACLGGLLVAGLFTFLRWGRKRCEQPPPPQEHEREAPAEEEEEEDDAAPAPPARRLVFDANDDGQIMLGFRTDDTWEPPSNELWRVGLPMRWQRGVSRAIAVAVLDRQGQEGIEAAEAFLKRRKPEQPPSTAACGATLLGYPCQMKGKHTVCGAEIEGFGIARWTDGDLFHDDGILGAVMRFQQAQRKDAPPARPGGT